MDTLRDIDSDDMLIAAYISGDAYALRALIERYTPPIYSYVHRIGGGDMSTDIVQEIFITVWKHLGNFDSDKASFKTWLFRIARNKAIDTLRKKRTLAFSDMKKENDIDESIDIEETLADDSPLPDIAFESAETIARAKNALDILPEHYKTVLVLHYENELTFDAIGKIMERPLNTVKSWHRRALALLRESLHQTHPIDRI